MIGDISGSVDRLAVKEAVAATVHGLMAAGHDVLVVLADHEVRVREEALDYFRSTWCEDGVGGGGTAIGGIARRMVEEVRPDLLVTVSDGVH